jgi:hypothetical protein
MRESSSNWFKQKPLLPVLLASAGFLLIYLVFINSLPGVELFPGYSNRFNFWYLPFFAAGLFLLAAGFIPVYLKDRHRPGGRLQEAETFQVERSRRFFEKFIYGNLYLTIFLALVTARLLIPFIDEPRIFRDTRLYISTAETPLTDPAFWRSERSFTLPLFYKLINVNTQNYEKRLALARVGNAQSTLAMLSWAALGLSLAAVVRTRWLRPLAFGLAVFFGLSLDLVLWDRIMLSESVSNSLFVLWIAGWTCAAWVWQHYENVRPWLRYLLLAGLLVVTTLYTFARDTNVYLVLFFAGLMLVGLLIRSVRNSPARRAYLALLVGLLLVCVFQNHTVIAGRRWQVPYYDLLAQRLLLDPSARLYFEQRGMPVNQDVLSLSSMPPDKYQQALRSDPRFSAISAWIDAQGRSAYLGYLLSRPVETLRRPLSDLSALVNPDLSKYRNPLIETPHWEAWLSRLMYPHSTFPLLIVLGLLAAALLIVAIRRGLQPAWLVPLALLASIYPLMFIVWHGGTLETERHAVQIALQLRLAGWMMLLFLTDFFCFSPPSPAGRRGSGVDGEVPVA